jgi:rubrerythrin
MSPRTKKNLNAAMEYDALASAKHYRFAARARLDENWDLADAFQEAADDEMTEDFATEARLEGVVASSADNLRNAIETEKVRVQNYSQFAREAREDGDTNVAVAFERIGDEKETRRAEFERILEKMQVSGSVAMAGK